MKLYLTLSLLSLYCSFASYGQQTTLLKAWSSANLAYIKIDPENVDFELYGHYKHQKRYIIVGDTLRLYDKYTSSRDNFSKEHVDNFDFLIKKLTNDKLIIIPLNSNAKDISNGIKKLKYIDRKNVIDSRLRFSQVRYHMRGGNWQWTDVSFSIDNKRNFNYVNKNKPSKPEYYSGTLSENQFNIFLSLLKSAEIDKLKSFKQIVYDAPENTLEVDYNGKSKHIKQNILPSITLDLVNFILELPKKVAINKVEPFQINFRAQ